jgi:hypothetical protein
VAGIAASFVLSIFTYHFVEFQKRKFQWKPILALAKAYGAFACFGLALRFYSGFPVRELSSSPANAVFFDSKLGTRFDDSKYLQNIDPRKWNFPNDFTPCSAEEQGSGMSRINHCAHYVPKNPTGPHLFLVGDSHATVYLKAMSEFWPGKVTLLASSSLPVVLNSSFDTIDARTGMAGEFRNFVAESEHILRLLTMNRKTSDRVILFFQHQKNLMEGDLKEAKNHSAPREVAAQVRSNLNRNRENYAKNFLATIELLTQNGGHVFLMKDNPIQGTSGWPFKCMEIKLWRTFRSLVQKEECLKFTPITSHLRELESILQQIEIEAQKSHLPFALLDPLPNLCSNGRCNALYENKLLYRDDNHLSHDGARLGARKIISDISIHLESFRHKNALSSR